MRLAKIEGGEVVNIIVSDSPLDGYRVLTDAEIEVGIGWLVDGDLFTNPNAPVIE